MNTRLILFFALMAAMSCSNMQRPAIYISPEASSLELLAAKEIRRYVYLRTDELLDIHTGSPQGEGFWLAVDTLLNEQEYALITEGNLLHINGGSEEALLWGAYEYAEQIGIRFYMHGDVIPDEKISFGIPQLDLHEKPLFKLRGVQPFHDFPEGPDWWNAGDYKALFAQLVKMKMNFFGLHTYPERKDFNGRNHKAELLTWIGKEEDVRDDGSVKAAYPALHFNTNDSTWGYMSKPTSAFSWGSAELFETDNFSTDYMKDVSAWPHTMDENIDLFNQTGAFFEDVFSFGRSLGLNICIGTETPLTIPSRMKSRYGISSESDEDIKAMYRGIFSRITRTYPIDYYWLWTPENWTWSGVSDEMVAKTKKDMQLAYEVLDELGAPFRLATCGWVLGPPRDRAEFDRILPKDMPFSCINRGVGYSPVEPGFSKVSGRPKWSIPWMEDDPDLISTQLWVGRLRKDALDSYLYGCTGLFGIHWRTRELGPNVSALAKAAWQVDEWQVPGVDTLRDLQTVDFYTDWVKSEFGVDSKELVELFVQLDSKGYEQKEGHKGDAPLNASSWIEGPGALMVDQSIDQLEERLSRYAFIADMELIRPQIAGEGNLDRFDYWLNNFRFNEALLETAKSIRLLDEAVARIKDEKDAGRQEEMARDQLLPLRVDVTRTWEKMSYILLQKISTNGELGILANLEMHSMDRLQLLERHDAFMTSLGLTLPDNAMPKDEYAGPTRIIVTTNQSLLTAGDDFTLRIRVLSARSSVEGKLLWSRMGSDKFQSKPFKHMARKVFEVHIPSEEIEDDFEYYIEVADSTGKVLFPATAGKINRTVVLLNSEMHQWYVGKMDPEEVQRRKEESTKFRERYSTD